MAIFKYFKHGGRRVLAAVCRDGLRGTVGMLRLYSQALRKQPDGVLLPQEIQFEVSNICNLHCPMCSYGRNDTGTRRPLLSKETFDAVFDQLPDLRAISFTGLGESLLNPDLCHFIRRAADRGVRTAMISNGLLFNARKAENVAEAGLAQLGLSIESGLPDAYASRRLGGTLEQFKASTEVLTALRRSRSSCFTISFNVLLTPDNVQDPVHIQTIIELAADREVPEITFQNAHDIQQHFGRPYNDALKNQLAVCFEKAKDYAQNKGIRCRFPSLERASNCCFYPWVYPYVTALGEFLPCCIVPQFGDYNTIIEELSFGNVVKTPIREVWNGTRAVAFRHSLRGEKPHPYCVRCSKYWNVL